MQNKGKHWAIYAGSSRTGILAKDLKHGDKIILNNGKYKETWRIQSVEIINTMPSNNGSFEPKIKIRFYKENNPVFSFLCESIPDFCFTLAKGGYHAE